MSRKRDVKLAEEIIKVLAREEPLNKRQIARRVGKGYSTAFNYLDFLRDSGFVCMDDVWSEKKHRTEVNVRLDLLGYLYIIWKQEEWKLYNIDEIKRKAFHGLTRFFDANKEEFEEKCERDPWLKLCFRAMDKRFSLGGSPTTFDLEIMEEIASNIFEQYRDDLNLNRLANAADSAVSDLILEGVKSAHKKYFIGHPIGPGEMRPYLETFARAFEELNDFEKAEVILNFKSELHSIIRPLIKELPKKIRESYVDKFKRAEPYQVVCFFRCPNCSSQDASLQDARKLLTSLTVKCEKCGGEFYLTSLPLSWDVEYAKEFYRRIRGITLSI